MHRPDAWHKPHPASLACSTSVVGESLPCERLPSKSFRLSDCTRDRQVRADVRVLLVVIVIEHELEGPDAPRPPLNSPRSAFADDQRLGTSYEDMGRPYGF